MMFWRMPRSCILGMAFSFCVFSADAGAESKAIDSFVIEKTRSTHDIKASDIPFSGTLPKLMSKREFEKRLAEVKKRAPVTQALARDVASSDWSGQQSAAYIRFKERFGALKSPEELHQLIDELDRAFASLPADLQIVTLSLTHLRVMRGFFYRANSLFDDIKFYKASAMTALGRALRVVHAQFPSQSMAIVQRYLQEPWSGAIGLEFKSENDVRVFLSTSIIKNHEQILRRLSLIDLSLNPIVDSGFLLGAGFRNLQTHRVLFGEAQRRGLTAAIYADMTWISVVAAHSVNGLTDLSYDLLKELQGDSTRSRSYIAGLSPATVVEVFERSSYRSLLTLMPKSGSLWMRFAQGCALKSAESALLYWNEVKGYVQESIPRYDPLGLGAHVDDVDAQLKTLLEILVGPATIRDAVSGRLVRVEINQFFENPPADRKKLFATEFKDESLSQTRVINVEVKGKKREVRIPDFSVGEPTGWNLKLWQQYFPEAKNQEDLVVAFRALSQNWGSLLPVAIIGTPLPPLF